MVKNKKSFIKKIMEFMTVTSMVALFLSITAMAGDKVENITTKAAASVVKNEDGDESITHYYKFKVNRSGIFTMAGKATNGIYTTKLNFSLCNGKGKVLDTRDVYDSTVAMYALKKGTYMIKIQTPYIYSFAHGFKKYGQKSGNSINKAVAMKRNKKIKGLVEIGEPGKRVDYYKFTLTSPAKVRVTCNVLASDNLTIKIVPSKTVSLNRSSVTKVLNNQSLNIDLYTTSYKPLPAGTYYIKIFRTNKKSSTNGVYELMWR